VKARRIPTAMPNLPTAKRGVSRLRGTGIRSFRWRVEKKELIGQFKNNGREGQAKGQDTVVNGYDFLSLAAGLAIPYGVYDLVHNRGLVKVGIDHETAEFAVERIRRWWRESGKALSSCQESAADHGGWRRVQWAEKSAVEKAAARVRQ